MRNKIILFAAFILVLFSPTFVFAEAFSSSTFSSSSSSSSFSSLQNYGYQYTEPSFRDIYSSLDINTYWPILNDMQNGQCEASSDFIVSIRPGGCTPLVVRSDLLEEQNVPVFCPLDALQINPLIKVSSIKSITFKGNYPKEILDIEFHPARAAVRSYTTPVNSPILENIGYVVIILKKNRNESSMPNEIKGNLTATIHYDAEKAFGTGRSEYYLPVISDDEWDREYNSYSFWQGKGFLRASSVSNNEATIQLYNDKEKVFTQVSLNEGETSGKVYFPGFFCRAGLKIQLNKITTQEKQAKLTIDNDEIWVREGSKILNSRCTVRDISGLQDGSGSVSLSCPKGNVNLILQNNGAKFSIGSQTKEYKISDLVFSGIVSGENSNKDLYLAYAGNLPDSISNDNREFAVLMESSLQQRDVLNIIQKIDDIKSKTNDINGFKNEIKSAVSGLFSGKDSYVILKDSSLSVGLNEQTFDLAFNGIAEKVDEKSYSDKNVNIETNFSFSDALVNKLIEEYPYEKEQIKIYGEESLWKQIILSEVLGKYQTAKKYLGLFIEKYSNSDRKSFAEEKQIKYSAFNYENARIVVYINNEYHYIQLEGFQNVDAKAKNIKVSSSGGSEVFGEGEKIYLSGEMKQVAAAETTTPVISVITPATGTAEAGETTTQEELLQLMNAVNGNTNGVNVLNKGNFANKKCYCDVSIGGSQNRCEDYSQWIIKYSAKYNVDPVLILSLMMQESNCRMNALSGVGAAGLMQIYSFSLCSEIGTEQEIKNNFEKNIECGIKILNDYHVQYGSQSRLFEPNGKTYTNWEAALRYYNGWAAGDTNAFVEEVSSINKMLRERANELGIALGASALYTGTLATSSTTTDTRNYLLVNRIDANSVNFIYYNYDARNGRYSTEPLTAQQGQTILKGERQITINEINAERVAYVTLIPQVDNTKTEADFTFNVGIEKRDLLKLTPDKAQDMLSGVEGDISTLGNLSDKLGKTIKAWKGACFATSSALMVKNLFAGFSGESLARQTVMKGYKEKCKTDSNYKGMSSTQCYNALANDINSDVQLMAKAISDTNANVKSIESRHTTEQGILGLEKVVNQEEAMKTYRENIKQTYFSGGKSETINGIVVNSGFLESVNEYSALREIELYMKLKSSGISQIALSKEQEAIDKLLAPAVEQNKEKVNLANIDSRLPPEFKGSVVQASSENNNFIWQGKSFTANELNNLINKNSNSDIEGAIIRLSANNLKIPVQLVSSGSYLYLILLESNGNSNIFRRDSSFKVETESGGLKLLESVGEIPLITNNIQITNPSSFGTCSNNVYKEPKVVFYETGSDKQLPAIVPFDKQNGWYVKVPQSVGGAFSTQQAGYTSAADVSFFYICNVGKNGLMDNTGGDDICQSFDVNSYANVERFIGCPDLINSQIKNLVVRARGVVRQAAQQFGSQTINIDGVGAIGTDSPLNSGTSIECQDMMSPEDCKLLFNACDPVICPSSRCNLGGKFPVANVPQTGIIGSIALCLPNAKEGIAVPICLTGVQAGLDSYKSVLEAERDCLTQSIETGQHVGICDEITSVYKCEFFWKQVSPLMNLLAPKIFEFAYGRGQGSRGGGEYLTVFQSFNNMQKSIDYFKNNYAQNAFRAFQLRNVQEAGSTVCRAFIGTSYPGSADFLDNLLEPESPTQFYAWFSESLFSDATVPSTSQYKVYYHIFAGKDQGVYYNIYLKNPPASSYYNYDPQFTIASGYVPAGEYKDATPDFTGPSGYKELCVSINGQAHCGFQQVSTDMGLNYLSDKYIKEQANQIVTTEKECISGTPSLLAVATSPNIQSGAENAINPNIALNGIVRICASQSPNSDGRWKDVGYCGNQNLRCYLDTQSVKDEIKNVQAVEGTTEQTQKQFVNIGGPGIATNEQANSKLSGLRDMVSELEINLKSGSSNINKINSDVDEIINDNEGKIYSNNAKAEALSLQVEAYQIMTKNEYNKLGETAASSEGNSAQTPPKQTNDNKSAQTSKINSIGFLVKGIEKTSGFKVNDIIALNINHNKCSNISVYLQKKLLGIDFLMPDEKIGIVEANTNPVNAISYTPSETGKYMFKINCLDEKNKIINSKNSDIIDVIEATSESSGSLQAKTYQITDIKFLADGQSLASVRDFSTEEIISFEILHGCDKIELKEKKTGIAGFFGGETTIGELTDNIFSVGKKSAGRYSYTSYCLDSSNRIKSERNIVINVVAPNFPVAQDSNLA